MGWMLFRLVLSLLFVTAVLIFAARVARKRGLGGRGQIIEVVARQSMTRASTVSVVQVGDRSFLIGATDTQVSLLAEMDPGAVADALAEAQEAPAVSHVRLTRPDAPGLLAGSVLDRHQWTSLVEALRERTVRRG